MPEVRVGVVGTGFIGRHFVASLARHEGYGVSRILTRRPVASVTSFPDGVVTNSIDDLIANSDVIVECSGDPIWATDIVIEAISGATPVVTMNTEFHITTGSAFVGKGLVTEAEGDQPGVLAALHLDAVAMGFEPIAYGNMKGFMNLDPTREDMEFWGAKQGISLSMVTSFTDGTKVQAEQILVGNRFGAGITDQGMMGPPVNGIEDAAQALVAESEELGGAVTDFVVGSSLPHGVFIVATHAEDQAAALEYFKMGPGPHYTIVRPNIFVHLEILKTIRGVLEREDILLDNSGQPTLSLGAVAKRDLAPGEKVEMGIGSFDLRGQAVRIAEHPDHLPIGLIVGATMESPIERGQLVSFSDMSLPESSATGLWRSWERTDAGSQ